MNSRPFNHETITLLQCMTVTTDFLFSVVFKYSLSNFYAECCLNHAGVKWRKLSQHFALVLALQLEWGRDHRPNPILQGFFTNDINYLTEFQYFGRNLMTLKETIIQLWKGLCSIRLAFSLITNWTTGSVIGQAMVA